MTVPVRRRARARRSTGARRGDRGAVTAELALGLPVLLAVTVALSWLLAVGVAQVRVQDAAREAARAVARGDDTAAAVALGRRVAPEGARISVRTGGGRVTVVTAARLRGPGGLVRLPGVEVRAEAVALAEESP